MSYPDAPIPWQRRSDLIVRQQQRGWILKDPVAQRYFQLGSEAYFVWSHLNGAVTVDGVCQSFASQFAPRSLTPDDLSRFLGQLVSQGLVWSRAGGAGQYIERRRLKLQQIGALSSVMNPLAIRFRGVDPDRVLTGLTRRLGWVFSPVALLLGLCFLGVSALFFGLRWGELTARLPEELAAWRVTDVFSLALVMAALKIVHELGHGIACKRVGGEVRELGVLLLVFTPCLYCNVSDAWLLPSRHSRILISAAGMWVESLVAVLALWLWWYSQPGWFHTLCLQAVFIGLVSTLLFNLNPLLRYDGYFILSDAWGIPNLQQRAQRELGRRLRWAFGLVHDPQPADDSPSRGRWLALYAALSFVYRLAMVCGILWLLDRWLEPQGLRMVARGIALLTITSLVWPPLRAMVAAVRDPELARRWQIDSPTRLLVATMLLTTLCLWPIPGRVHLPVVLLPRAASPLFVTLEGRLVEIVPPGTAVRTGDVIASLENPPLTRELTRLSGERDRLALVVQSLERRTIAAPRAVLQLPAAQRQFADLEQQLAQRQADAERLVLRAPHDGVVWPTAPRPEKSTPDALPLWAGSLFDPQQLGCWLEPGTQLGWVGPADRIEARAVIPQQELSRIQVGQPVRVMFQALPEKLSGNVEEIAAARLSNLGSELVGRLRLPEVMEESGTRLVGSWYQVKIPVDQIVTQPVALGVGQAAIQTAPASLLERGLRWLRETFSSTR